MDVWMQWISEVGFPIIVTFYLLHRIEQKLDQLNQSIQSIPVRQQEIVENNMRETS
ncbi:MULTISPECIES: YvrJ family protein [Bacillus]|uniref:YvrJ family protein n=1 Tax=Bacillus capparidis TaxID=1840411 RepID=A0ABS4CW18_9BACI|nr:MULTISPECIES: YvrJ family protein [Bacillus]MBP1081205.1 hypothetical protein [Bacillus capparidis]MED1095885.1 YvrJ family protein [Bacillus capparidis]